MPRASKVSLTVVPVHELDKHRKVLAPASKLRADERVVFDLIATNNVHLTKLDVPLMEAYAIASARVSTKGRSLKIADLDKNVRMLMLLATKLRITPQSRIDPEKLSRHMKNAVRNKGVWENNAAEEDDEVDPVEEDTEA